MTDEEKIDALREALHQILLWCDAYPVNWEQHQASNVRFALDGIGKIARAALEVTER